MKTDSRNIEVPELPEIMKGLEEARRQWMQTDTYALAEALKEYVKSLDPSSNQPERGNYESK